MEPSASTPSRCLKTLLIGITGRARWVFKQAKPEAGYEIVALADIKADALEAGAAELGLEPGACIHGETPEACHAAVERALEKGGVDCIIICTPTLYHVPYAKLGIAAGIPVLTEKGMAPDWAGAQELVQFTKEHKGICCVAQNYRYRRIDLAMRACVEGRLPEFEIGPIHHIDLIQHRVRPFPRTLNYPFASVWDMSCHHFDLLRGLVGKPLALTAHAYGPPWSPYTHPNNTAIHLEFENGAHAHYFHGHDSARALYHFCLQGEKGALLVQPREQSGDVNIDATLEYNPRPTEQFGSRPAVAVPVDTTGVSEAGVLADFHRYVCDGIAPGICAEENLEVMAMCQMTVLSIEKGRRILRSELD